MRNLSKADHQKMREDTERTHENNGMDRELVPSDNGLLEWIRTHKEQYEAFNDVTGAELDPKRVADARRLEVEYIRNMGVYSRAPRVQAHRSGKKVIPVRWIDVNKGDKANPDYRSRMVAKDIKHKWDVREELFAATPPLEAFRLVLSHAATVERGAKRRCVMTNDVRRAYFHATVMGEIYVELPDEDRTEEDEREDLVGKLNLCFLWHEGSRGGLAADGHWSLGNARIQQKYLESVRAQPWMARH